MTSFGDCKEMQGSKSFYRCSLNMNTAVRLIHPANTVRLSESTEAPEQMPR